jgi:hypothetical protein
MKDHFKEREIVDFAKKNFAVSLQKRVSGATSLRCVGEASSLCSFPRGQSEDASLTSLSRQPSFNATVGGLGSVSAGRRVGVTV